MKPFTIISRLPFCQNWRTPKLANVLIIPIFIFAPLLLQANEVDSLKRLVQDNTLTDVEKLTIILQIVERTSDTQPAIAVEYALQTRAIAERNKNDLPLQLLSLKIIALAYTNYHEPDKLLQYGFQFFHHAEKLRDTANIAHALFIIGYASGQFSIRNDTAENTEALHKLRQALSLAQKHRDTSLMISCYNSIGRCYRRMQQWDSALYYHRQALIFSDKAGDAVNKSWAFYSMGVCYAKKKRYAEALEYSFQGLTIRQRTGNPFDIIISLNRIAQIYYDSGNTPLALQFAQRSYALADSANAHSYQLESTKLLAIIQERQGQYYEALKYHKRFTELRDSVSLIEHALDIRLLEGKLKAELQQQQHVLLQQKSEQQELALRRQTIMIAVMVCLALGLGVGLLALGRVRQKVLTSNQRLRHLLLSLNLREKELQLIKEAVNHSSDSIEIADVTGRYMYANDRACELLGYSREELYHKRVQDLSQRFQEPGSWEQHVEEVRRAPARFETFISVGGEHQTPFEFTINGVEIDNQRYHVAIARDISKQKRLEQQLLARFSILADKTTNVVIVTDKTGNIVWVNQGFTTIMEYTFDEVLGKNPAALLSGPKTNNNTTILVRDAITQGLPFEGEFINYTKSKKPVWFYTTMSPMYEEGGILDGYIAIGTDITQRKEAEEALLRSEGTLRAMFEGSIQAHFFIDTHRTLLACNSVAKYVIAEVFDRPLTIGEQITDYKFTPHFEECIQRAAVGEWIADEISLRYSDNSVHWFTEYYSPVYNDTSGLLGIAYSLLDITDRKQLQSLLLENAERLQHIITSMMDGIILLDSARNIILVNPATTTMFNYTREQLTGKNLEILLPDYARASHHNNIDGFLHDKLHARRYKRHFVEGRKNTGDVFPIEASIAHFQIEGEALLLAVVRDITEKLQAEEEIRELNRTLAARVEERTAALVSLNQEKNELLSIVSHDLKNPLAVIRSSAEIIEECFGSGDTIDYGNFANSITRTCDDMLEIITNFLDIEAIENGKITPALFPIPMENVQSHVQRFQKRAEAKNIHLHYTQTTEPVFILGDTLILRQILDNLLSNALKFSPRSKNVYADVADIRHTIQNTTETRVRIRIRDEGPGISAEDQIKLFGKFTRLSARPTAQESSTGLGLSIVKKLVTMMNGSVWCESTLGEGATFIVELPATAKLHH